MSYESIPLFYQEWDDDSSVELLACDEELQLLCKQLHGFDLSGVKSLKLHYESDTAEGMTQKIRSIASLQGLATPSVKVNDRFIPDFNSRYFTADFSYGLAIIREIAVLAGVNVPHIQKLFNWYRSVSADKHQFSYSEFGIHSYKEFVSFYAR